MSKKRFLIAAAVAVLVAALAGCGSSSSGGSGNTAPLTFATFNPYSGPDASFGPELGAGCYPAATLIGQAGGVLGHKQIKCVVVDTRGDPADAVPAAAQMIANTSNLVGVLGPSSDEAAATAPRINTAHIPMFADTGQKLFDHNLLPYFWRIVSPDDVIGYVEALWAHQHGYKRAVLVHGNDISSQGTVPTIISGFKKLGGTVALQLTLALDQSSYRSEVERLIAAKPDVIFNEIDPQTAATFFGELKQLQGTVQPLDSTAAQYTPWIKAVSKAIGTQTLATVYHTTLNTGQFSGPAYEPFKTNLLTSPQVSNPKQWLQDVFSESGYDTVNVCALAMLAAHSTNPAVFNSYIPKVTDPAPGATVVHTFAAGKAALAAGKRISYSGATGQLSFDQWHNSAGGFEVLGFAQGNGQQPIVATYSASAVTSLKG
jgi:branched-chain amino acid transport system substrate-binding protein